MSESKVYKVQLLVEREHPADNPKVRIYLSLVRENIWKDAIWPKIKDCCKWVIHMIFKILLSAAITQLFGEWALYIAYLERGYVAYGGECLLVIVVFLATFEGLGLLKRKKGD